MKIRWYRCRNIQTDLWSKVNSQEHNINVPLLCDKDDSSIQRIKETWFENYTKKKKKKRKENYTKASGYLFWEES